MPHASSRFARAGESSCRRSDPVTAASNVVSVSVSLMLKLRCRLRGRRRNRVNCSPILAGSEPGALAGRRASRRVPMLSLVVYQSSEMGQSSANRGTWFPRAELLRWWCSPVILSYAIPRLPSRDVRLRWARFPETKQLKGRRSFAKRNGYCATFRLINSYGGYNVISPPRFAGTISETDRGWLLISTATDR